MSFLFLKPQCQSAFGNATATDSNKANQGDIMTPCPAVSPRVPFCAHNGHKFPGPCIILLKNVITPLRTPLMTIRENVQHVHNGNKFRGPYKILVKNVITPPLPLMTLREHVQHVEQRRHANPEPPFSQTSFFKFATVPRDRTWHTSKYATLPRPAYQSHAKNNNPKNGLRTLLRRGHYFVPRFGVLFCDRVYQCGVNIRYL